MDRSPIAIESTIWLDQPFPLEEVHNVVFQLDKETSIAMFHKCWDVIKEDLEDLLRAFLEFHYIGVINQSINATYIALGPKKKGKTTKFQISYYNPNDKSI